MRTKIFIFLFFLRLAKSCSSVDSLNNCCSELECTGQFSEVGGLICCAHKAKLYHKKRCEIMARRLINPEKFEQSCGSLAKNFLEPCVLEASGTLANGEYVCYLLGLEIFRNCGRNSNKNIGSVCDWDERNPKRRILSHKSLAISGYPHLSAPSFPKDYTIVFASYFGDTVTRTNLIKSEDGKGSSLVYHKNLINNSFESASYFSINKTINLSAGECRIAKGAKEPLDVDFLTYFKAKLKGNFAFSSAIVYENRMANLWVAKQPLSASKTVSFHYVEGKKDGVPLEFKIFLNDDLLVQIKVEKFSKEAHIDCGHEIFKACEKCNQLTSCEQIKDFPQCGWCSTRNQAFLLDPLQSTPSFCKSDPSLAPPIVKFEDCSKANTQSNTSESKGNDFAEGFEEDECGSIMYCEEIQQKNILKNIFEKSCGWCPSSKKALLGNFYHPYNAVCQTTEEGQWTKDYRDCDCLHITNPYFLRSRDNNCGWCPFYQKAFIGDIEGPLLDQDCPATAEHGQWIFDEKHFFCLMAKRCSDLKGTDCGWCPSLKKSFLGDSAGPYDGIVCPTTEEGQWIPGYHDCVCLTATSPMHILSTRHCGWCPFYDKAFIGNSEGPLFNRTCPSSEKGEWVLGHQFLCSRIKKCEDIANLPCFWCPSLKKALNIEDMMLCSTTQEGQLVMRFEDCSCRTATSPDQIFLKKQNCGWCPFYNRAFIGIASGPILNQTCPATVEHGQWVFKRKNLKCLTATSCEDILNTDCGWCPSLKKAFLGNAHGPFNGIICPRSEDGQWTFDSRDCQCTAIMTIAGLANSQTKNCGWCPFYNRTFIGNLSGPSDKSCPATVEHGQWIFEKKNLKCLSAKKCEDIDGTDCGWCPSLQKAFLGDVNGPISGIVCSNTEEGQWISHSTDCICLTATSPTQLKGTRNCGWCPIYNKSLIGNEAGPILNRTCPGTAPSHSWVFGSALKCLALSKCGEINGTECGWCPSLRKGFPGEFEGPYNGIECPANGEGQWTRYLEGCSCQKADSPLQIKEFDNCGWCPFYNKAFIGTITGPLHQSCPATAEHGHWMIWWELDCLFVKSCEEIKNTRCGWCPSLRKAFIGNNHGPLHGIICPTTEEGQWIPRFGDCSCQGATSADGVKALRLNDSFSLCGWCPVLGRAFIGDINGPISNRTCPSSPEKGGWAFNISKLECFQIKTCQEIKGTYCGWCPSLKKAYFGNFYGPFDGFSCPTTDEGQWTRHVRDCDCLTATSYMQILNTLSCGWCPYYNKGFLGNEEGPQLNKTCPPSAEKGSWMYDKIHFKCISIKKCEDIAGTGCGWCPSLKRAFSGNLFTPYGGAKCPTTEEGQWIGEFDYCLILTATTPEQIKGLHLLGGWCPYYGKAFIGDSKGPMFNQDCPATVDKGQWTFDLKNLKCLVAKKCEDIAGTDCGWCTSSNKAFIGNKFGPYDGITCPTNDEGQWIFKIDFCEILTATSPEQLKDVPYVGWCPYHGRAFVGNRNGPFHFDQRCPASAEKGQWIYEFKNLKCLTAKKCEDIEGTDCGWCPSLKKAFLGDMNGPFDEIICPTTEEGQWIINIYYCRILTATSPQQLMDLRYLGWCPYHGKAFVGDETGPFYNQSCPATAEKGQWIYEFQNLKCLTAKNCEDIAGTDCGWCPSLKKAFLGDIYGPDDEIICPTTEAGQWIGNIDYCQILTATSPEILKDLPHLGWCPYHGKAFVGDITGPFFNQSCPATAAKEQWIYGHSNLKCLTAKNCEDIAGTDCGWCPSLKKAYLGDFLGPYGDINCPTTDEGQWILSLRDCICLNATSYEQLRDTFRCGWCPYHGKGLIGYESGPTFNTTCPPSAELGQWTYLTKNFKCLSAKVCEDIDGTDCGWCPSLKKAYLGDFYGPEEGINCPTTEEGQWIFHVKDCVCLNATSYEQIIGSYNCGWCPYYGKGYIGNEYGPILNKTCPASLEKGQWTLQIKNYKCLLAQTCEDIEGTDCGWCPGRRRAYFGNFHGPFDGITCETTDEGQWIRDFKDCVCLFATTYNQLIGSVNCGWCPYYQKGFIGDHRGPILNKTCPATPQHGQWTLEAKNFKCFSVKNCEETEGTDCGWCPSLQKAFLGDFEGPYDGIVCPASSQGQWTFYTADCKCLNLKTCEHIKDTNCGWCKSTQRAIFAKNGVPILNGTCPNHDGNQLVSNGDYCSCSQAKSCEDTPFRLKCGWCPSLQRVLPGGWSGPSGSISCPSTNQGQWTFSKLLCACLKIKSCFAIKFHRNCGWCTGAKRAFIGDRFGPESGIDCPGKWIWGDAKLCFSQNRT